MHVLKIYVSGLSPYLSRSMEKLQKVLDEKFKGQYTLKIIDILENPELSAEDNIFATPTIVRSLPEPLLKMIGDISNTEKIMVGLELMDGN